MNTGPGGGRTAPGRTVDAGALARCLDESGPPTREGVFRLEASRPPIPTTVPARAVGIETPEAGAETERPSLLKTARLVANAFSACALVPVNEMNRWFRGIAPIEKP